VIGAGPSGLVALKELAERGHDVVAFEEKASLGGVFSGAYKNLTLTTSNVNIAFGAYPLRAGFTPTMWTSKEYVEYLRDFARYFDLVPRICFSTRVESLYRNSAGEGWLLETSQRGNAAPERHEFDHVVICSGLNSQTERPILPGEDRFRGEILHSSEFTSAERFRGRRVLVVGLGESGSDIALEIARVAQTSAVSTRNGPGYVIPRYFGAMVSDLDTNRCYHAIPRCLAGRFPLNAKSRIEQWYRSPADDAAVLGVARELNAARGLPWQRRIGTKNTAFIEAMLYHGMLYKPELARVEADQVVFTDGSSVPCDTIICCTGFAPSFPFLADNHPELAEKARSPRRLFKRSFHPDYGAGLAWVGFVRPGIGSIPPCAEMQARYVALVVGGERELPPADAMRADIEREARLDLEQFPDDAPRLGALTDYMRFLNGLGRLIGCNPPLAQLFCTKPTLWAKVMFGPIAGAQFRLVGPGATPASAETALRELPTMPRLVLAYEFAILAASKVLSLLGVRRLRPIGF
jgi:dimethylaniline monooxygenase (N-oxide forming)